MYSWEVPIEESILEFTRNMKQDFQRVMDKPHGFFDFDKGLRREAGNYKHAYETIEKFVEREIKMRHIIKDVKHEEEKE